MRCSLINLIIGLILIQFYSINSISIQNAKEAKEDQLKDCCLVGRKYASIKQDSQHFIQLDQLNLDRRRRTNIDQIAKSQTNLAKLFTKIHLNHHFYTNSTVCETKDKNTLLFTELPINSEECQFEFTNCCLDEQLQISTGIDFALRTRFKQNSLDASELNAGNEGEKSKDNHEIEYTISTGEMIRSNCILLTNKNISDKSESMNSIKMLRIGQNVAFDCCEACSFGIDNHDQFENCNLIDENNLHLNEDNHHTLWQIIFKQCCRIVHLSRLAENRGLIKMKKLSN